MQVQAVKNNAIIKVNNLSKNYKYYKKKEGLKGSIYNLFRKNYLYKEAVKSISFDINQGEILGLIGLNGAGKTTTLKMLSGLLCPTSGKIEIMGFEPFRKDKNFLKQISLVMGNKSQLWWDLPAIDSFNLTSHIYEMDNNTYKNNLDAMVDMFDVGELLNIQVRRLSLGERMKMEMIAALLHNPKVIFLDEPTIGLDVMAQYNIRNFLKNYNKLHKSTIIVTSHNFNDIVSLCDKLILLDKGEIIYNDSFSNFSNQFSSVKNVIVKIKVGYQNNFNYLLKKFNGAFINDKELHFNIADNIVNDFMLEIVKVDMSGLEDIQIENVSIEEIVYNIYSGAK